jgi:microcystin-dependent protein
MSDFSNLSRRRTGDLPAGCILPFGGTVPPEGWLICDGSAISRTLYIRMFLNIGIEHGYGDTITTFNIPDGRGLFLRGWDNGAGHDPDAASRVQAAAGGNAGDLVGSYQADQNLDHTHPANVGGGNAGFTHYATWLATTNVSLAGTLYGYIGYDGGNQANPRNLNINWIIKI